MEELKAYLMDQIYGAEARAKVAAKGAGHRLEALSELSINLSDLANDHPNLFFLWYAWHKQRASGEAVTHPETAVAERIRCYGEHSADDGDPIRFLRALVDLIEEPGGAA